MSRISPRFWSILREDRHDRLDHPQLRVQRRVTGERVVGVERLDLEVARVGSLAGCRDRRRRTGEKRQADQPRGMQLRAPHHQPPPPPPPPPPPDEPPPNDPPEKLLPPLPLQLEPLVETGALVPADRPDNAPRK